MTEKQTTTETTKRLQVDIPIELWNRAEAVRERDFLSKRALICQALDMFIVAANR